MAVFNFGGVEEGGGCYSRWRKRLGGLVMYFLSVNFCNCIPFPFFCFRFSISISAPVLKFQFLVPVVNMHCARKGREEILRGVRELGLVLVGFGYLGSNKA